MNSKLPYSIDNAMDLLANAADDEGLLFDGHLISSYTNSKVFCVLGLPGEGLSHAGSIVSLGLAGTPEGIKQVSYRAMTQLYAVFSYGEPSSDQAFGWLPKLFSEIRLKSNGANTSIVRFIDELDGTVPVAFQKEFGHKLAEHCNSIDSHVVLAFSSPAVVEALIQKLDQPPAIVMLKGRQSFEEWKNAVHEGITHETYLNNEKRFRNAKYFSR